MSKRTFAAVAGVMITAAAAVRIHNALTFPSLRGYDGFGHFTYIWYVSETWRVPLATSGWSFFHPPLYYALMAALWKALAGIDPLTRLKVGSLLMALLGLTHAAASYVIVRRYFPKDRLIHLLAPGLVLFIPVHIYSAPFLGNEGLAAVLCSVSLLVLLAVLARPSLTRSLGLGLALGLAMLAKFSSFAVVLGALGAIGLQALARGQLRSGARTLAVVAAVTLAVCGWYYARNLSLYGTPFKLSRGEFMVRHVESEQPQAARTLLEYLSFDPLIFRRPSWPRGFSPTGDLYPGGGQRWLRESVWTGVYANAWFDGFGGWVVPPVTESEIARRGGQVLLCLGTVPTAITLLGLWTALGRLRRGFDDTIVALLLVFVAMTASFVLTTHAIPIPAIVKATYFMPVSVTFSFWFAFGLARLRERHPRWLPTVAGVCSALALAASIVFSHGLLFDPAVIWRSRPLVASSLENVYGVVYFAAGKRERAAEYFRSAADAGWHLGYENLAALTFDAGRPLEAVHLLKRAAQLQPEQAIGRPAERSRFIASTQAEYLNTLAVFYHRLGWREQALEAAEQATRLDASIPEAHYNFGFLKLIAPVAHGSPSSDRDRTQLRQAMSEFSYALDLDKAFRRAAAMLGVAQALSGDCATAEHTIADAFTPHPELQRTYPVETGPGIEHAAGIERRRTIDDVPPELEAAHLLEECRRQNPKADVR